MFEFGGKILCPFCFKKTSKSKLPYGCIMESCTGKRTVNIHIIKDMKPSKGFCECDLCHRTTSRRVCPECGMQLPDNIQEDSTEIVSIVGAKSSGKSYYVASLLRQIHESGMLARYYQASTMWLMDSKDQYNTRYKSSIDRHMRLKGSNLETNIVKDNPPLLLEVKFPKAKNSKVFSFFDAAGENFEDLRVVDAIRPYLAHSSAIIMILDPMQVVKLRIAIDKQFPGLGTPSESSFTEVLRRTKEIICEELKLNPQKKVNIPLCIAISKWDLVLNTPGLVPEGLMVSKQNLQNTSSYDPGITETASQELRSLMMDWEANLVTTVDDNFSSVKFFAFSAWGLVNSVTNTVPELAPYRVEEPMLWIWKNQKLI